MSWRVAAKLVRVTIQLMALDCDESLFNILAGFDHVHEMETGEL